MQVLGVNGFATRIDLLFKCHFRDAQMKSYLLSIWKKLTWAEIKSTQPLPIGEGVLDQSGVSALEIDNLFVTINHAETVIGQSVLFRSLVQPLNTLADIKKKQDAVEELRRNSELRNAIQTVVTKAISHENDLYILLFGEFLPMFGTAKNNQQIEGYGYLQYRRGIRFVTDLVTQIQNSPQPESEYLCELFERIKAFANTRIYALMTKAVYLTETTMQTKQEHRKTWWLPAIVFYPRIFKPSLFFLLFAIAIAILVFLPSILMEVILASPLLLIYFPIVGGFDRDNFIIPLRNLFKDSEEFSATLDALGQLDEMLSFLKFAENFPHTTVLPSLTDESHHQIVLQDAKNPILGKNNPDYVGNNLTLTNEKILLITGPNSGGKTAFCKTISQLQLLAQIGCFVPARSATLSVADRIFYQAPEISRLNDGEGRFGAELKRTKEIFLASSAKSLVILDELSEGTTFEEKMESSFNTLHGFYRKGNSTLLITHNHQLVDELVKKQLGMPKQVEFLDDMPTHKIIDGISRVSHAERVAKKIGFSKEDIELYLTNENQR